MNRYEQLMLRAKNGVTLLMDGATGTEAERRGIPQLKNAWNGGAALFNQDILRKIHEDYIKCGAEIVISNTFANSKHALEDAGEGHNFINLNKAGIKIALEARDNMSKENVLVAGGISYWTWTGRKPSLKQLGESVEEQAKIMASSGADLLILEMMIDIEQMLTTLKAAKLSGLPIWVGLTCKPNDRNEVCLEGGDTLKDTIEVLLNKDVDVINIMHTEIEYISHSIKSLKSRWPGLIGVYPHSGSYKSEENSLETEWNFKGIISPKRFVSYAKVWKDLGVNFLGGCCGINLDYIKLLAKIIYKM